MGWGGGGGKRERNWGLEGGQGAYGSNKTCFATNTTRQFVWQRGAKRGMAKQTGLAYSVCFVPRPVCFLMAEPFFCSRRQNKLLTGFFFRGSGLLFAESGFCVAESFLFLTGPAYFSHTKIGRKVLF